MKYGFNTKKLNIMKKTNLFIFTLVALFTFLSLTAKADSDYEPAVTKWIDASGKPKPLHKVFKTKDLK